MRSDLTLIDSVTCTRPSRIAKILLSQTVTRWQQRVEETGYYQTFILVYRIRMTLGRMIETSLTLDVVYIAQKCKLDLSWYDLQLV